MCPILCARCSPLSFFDLLLEGTCFFFKVWVWACSLHRRSWKLINFHIMKAWVRQMAARTVILIKNWKQSINQKVNKDVCCEVVYVCKESNSDWQRSKSNRGRILSLGFAHTQHKMYYGCISFWWCWWTALFLFYNIALPVWLLNLSTPQWA